MGSESLLHFWPLLSEYASDEAEPAVDPTCEETLSPWYETGAGAELGLLKVLSSWSPWEVPSTEIVQSLQDVGALGAGDLPLKSKARQLALQELKREDEAYSDTFIL